MTISIGLMQESPLGSIWIAVGDKGLVAISLWHDEARFIAEVTKLTGTTPVHDETAVEFVATQLDEYFRQERREFDLPIDWSVMTPFQQEALRKVYAVGYGRLTTYGDVATDLGKPTAVRAVGRANATNPIPIVIPCHRVLGADGKLHGYSAPDGLETKAFLLRLEGSWLI